MHVPIAKIGHGMVDVSRKTASDQILDLTCPFTDDAIRIGFFLIRVLLPLSPSSSGLLQISATSSNAESTNFLHVPCKQNKKSIVWKKNVFPRHRTD